MSAHVLAPETLASRTTRIAVKRDRFFAVMSGVTLLIVLAGFTPTLYLRPLFKPVPIPAYLYFHGIVLTAWFVWFFVQTLLVQTGRTILHRKFGVAGAVLAALVPVAGLMATAGVVPRIVSSGVGLDDDASAIGIGGGVPVIAFVGMVVWGNALTALVFPVIAGTGILQRRKPATHKRLMLIATIAIIGPPVARLARLPFLGGEGGSLVPTVIYLLLFTMVLHDALTNRKIHPATVFGAAVVVAVMNLSGLIAGTEAGRAVVRWLA